MGHFSSFDGLPLIVHDAILRSLASPWDVANLIRASPGSLQAYTTGSPSSVLLSALRKVLSLENQHLMNIVVAAGHHLRTGHWLTRTTAATKVELEGIASRDELDQALRCVFQKVHPTPPCPKPEIHHLSPNTIDSSTRLFAIIHKAIQTYSLYTMARAQRRVTRDSGPQTFASLSTLCVAPALQDGETQRLWRAFLLYQLFCVVWGLPQIGRDVNSDQEIEPPRDFPSIRDLLSQMPVYMREELSCIREYVCEQYLLAFNEVVGSFSLAVARMGQRTASATDSSNSLPDESLRLYRYPGCAPGQEGWPFSMSLLGPGFWQDFLSHDATARLHFFRATFHLFNKCRFQTRLFFSRRDTTSLRYFKEKVLHSDLAELPITYTTRRRLRAVGWAFWDDPDRLASMDLVPGRVNAAYGNESGDPTEQAREVRAHLARDFGTVLHQNCCDDIKRLFRSACSLKFSEVISAVTGPRDQKVRGTEAEATVSDGRLEQKPGDGRLGSKRRQGPEGLFPIFGKSQPHYHISEEEAKLYLLMPSLSSTASTGLHQSAFTFLRAVSWACSHLNSTNRDQSRTHQPKPRLRMVLEAHHAVHLVTRLHNPRPPPMKQLPVPPVPISTGIIILNVKIRVALELAQGHRPARDIAIRQQVHHRPRVRLHRHEAHPERLQDLREPALAGVHACLHEPRHYGVDADPLARKGDPGGAEQPPRAELGPGVDDARGQRDEGLGAEDEDHAPAPRSRARRGRHVQLRQLGAEHGALGVEVDGPRVWLGWVLGVHVRHARVVREEEGLVHDAGVHEEVV
ncbi:hypothetical protein KVR01_004150 [Diaporthe batatas]|uniref:uncharacterized protein n=1 Tax=Diaporthe batatas TaxID=748121 RepID=UPI001D04258E|nr:uncharacterized protein KVR01_004150 [Diaporthe batatas]KAG8165598.1 hypothetical protein KVR01_004150 [Diaporthe batatas]